MVNIELYKYSEIDKSTVFYELTDYGIEFDNCVPSDLQNYKSVLKMVSSNTGILNFGNSVGRFALVDKQIRVVSKKISSENYEVMLREITKVMAQLPFDFNSIASEETYIDTINSSKILYHTFLILKYVILNDEVNFQGAFESIFSNPCRKNEQINAECNIWEASNVSSGTLVSLVQNPQQFCRLESFCGLKDTTLAKRLSVNKDTAFYPAKVIQSRIVHSLDTSENRFVKHFLKLCVDILYCFSNKVSLDKCLNKYELQGEIRSMIEITEELLSHYFFKEVGEMTTMPFNSTVLQKRNGYKEITYFYNLLQSSLILPISEEKAMLIIENKDISELYELWTYFKMVEVIGEITGTIPESAETLRENDFKAYLQKSVSTSFILNEKVIKVWYNKTYGSKKESYSLPLRPDIVIEVNGECYIFDAKFKLENVNWDCVEEEKNFIFKNGDIYKMHTYKDAIEGVKFACILYPNPDGNKVNLYWEDEINKIGVGAIPFLVGVEPEGLKNLLNKILN